MHGVNTNYPPKTGRSEYPVAKDCNVLLLASSLYHISAASLLFPQPCNFPLLTDVL
jgi:hypothetical protein